MNGQISERLLISKILRKVNITKEFYNRKARHEFQILDSFEAGIVLTGDEIKAIRNGRVDMTASHVKILNGEVFWLGGNINIEAGDRQRTRKLLLRKDQIKKLIGKTAEQGMTLVALKMYFKKGKAKLEVGLGRGMRKYEKRAVLKERDIQKTLRQELKNRNQK